MRWSFGGSLAVGVSAAVLVAAGVTAVTADAATSGATTSGAAKPVAAPVEALKPSSGHYQVKDGVLYDPCGQRVVLRGVSRMFEYQDPQGVAMPQIAKSGANVVRIFWQTDKPASALEPLIIRAVKNKLIPMIELHDATGDWNKMSVIKKWWAAADTIAVVKRHNGRLLLNIANEAGGDSIPVGTFAPVYNEIIAGLRKAGITAPAVVDAARWGRDASGLLDAAPTILKADPQHNVIFSWHVYEGTPANIDAAFARAASLKVDLIVGEFGPKSPGACSNSVPWQYLIGAAQKKKVGWLAGPGTTPMTPATGRRCSTWSRPPTGSTCR
jgi:mannan endo-1,4-beta-mannosidase